MSDRDTTNDRLQDVLEGLRERSAIEAGVEKEHRRLAVQLFKGLLWFAILSMWISSKTNAAFGAVFCVVLTAGLGCGILAVVWMARSRSDTPLRFSIASLLLATFYIALFAGGVRWLVTAQAAARPTTIGTSAFANLVSIFIVLMSAPMVIGLLDSLAWMAAWLVRRPSVRRWLAGWLGR